MNTRNLLASAAVAAVLGLSVPAHAQLLGGGATGGLGGTLSGGLRNVDVTGRGGVMGSIDADTSAVGGVRRTVKDAGSRTTDRVKDTAGKAKEKANEKTIDTVSSTDASQMPVKAPATDKPAAASPVAASPIAVTPKQSGVNIGADASASASHK